MEFPSTYNSTSTCILSNSNCLEFIKTLPDEAVNLTVTSPPYFMGKEYDRSHDINEFIESQRLLLPEVIRVTKNGGSICWQVGYHVTNQEVIPLDYLVWSIFKESDDLRLRNRIVWMYGHGLHSKKRFSGRHEVILWFTKGDDYQFNLDAVRVPQKYPGKRHYKGDKRGEFSGNPLGKNPEDVWEIPNVKAGHVEKTLHPCQFPVALIVRLVRALTSKGELVFDPYMGSGSAGVAALLEDRRFIGCEIEKEYFRIAQSRCEQSINKDIKIRPLDKPIHVPAAGDAVAHRPDHFTWG